MKTPEKLTIVCDLDSILVNLLGPWLDWYNRTYNDQLTVAHLTAYHIEKIVKPECGWKVFDFFDRDKPHSVQPPAYHDLPALPGAVEALRVLHDHGHDIIISTAVAGETAGDKFTWCKKNIPFIKQSHIMVGSRKERLHCDIFIDDAPKNLEAHRAAWPDTLHLAIAYPYNAEVPGIVRAESWNDTRAAWAEICYRVARRASTLLR